MSETEQETQTEQEFGPDGQGNYITPYKFTIIFNPDSVFETAVAYLCDQAQLVPFLKGDDYSAVAKNCEHPSPELLIFDHGFSQEDISKFFDRGFELVHIFSPTTTTKYNRENSDEPFNERVAVFSLLEIYEHALLLPGIMPMLMLEYILCAEFHQYESLLRNKDVNHVNGKLLCEMLRLDRRPVGEVILRTASTYKCEDIIRSYVAQGRAIHEERERLSLAALQAGVSYTFKSHRIYAVCGGPLTPTMIKIMPTHPKLQGCDFVLFYNTECFDLENNTYSGWRLTLVSLKSDVSAFQKLHALSEQCLTVGDVSVATGIPLVSICEKKQPFIFSVSGDINIATVWLPALYCMGILPFIYPDYEEGDYLVGINISRSDEDVDSDDKMESKEDSDETSESANDETEDAKVDICYSCSFGHEDETIEVANETVESMDISE